MEPAGRYALEPLEEVAERTLRFSILWTVSLSYPVSLPWVLGTALAAPFPPFPDMASSIPGPADPALRVSDSPNLSVYVRMNAGGVRMKLYSRKETDPFVAFRAGYMQVCLRTLSCMG